MYVVAGSNELFCPRNSARFCCHHEINSVCAAIKSPAIPLGFNERERINVHPSADWIGNAPVKEMMVT
jgi:hypothetical protein